MSEFTYCLNTSTIRPTPLLEKVAIAGRLGYRAIEPWNDEVWEFERQGGSRKDLKNALRDAGLTVVSMIALHGWIDAEGDDYLRVLDDCRSRMDQAAYLESPYIVASPPPGVVDLDRATARFGELMRLGRSLGVLPAMEFLGFVAGVHTLDSAWRIAAGTGDPEATVVADVFHLVRGGGSIDDIRTIPGDRLACFHINDSPPSPPRHLQTDADRVMLGEGEIDLARVIGNLRAIGFHGPLSLELFNRALWAEDPTEVAQRGLERMRALVEG